MIDPKLIEWLTGNDTGLSSKAIAAYLGAGVKRNSFPSDCDDFGRCWRLIELMGWQSRVPEIAEINEHWAVIVEHWDELADAYLNDKGRVYSILNRIEPEGYEREGFEVVRRDDGTLASAFHKRGASTINLGGMQVRSGA